MTENVLSAEVIALETRRGAALVARNRSELDALFPEDLVHIHSTGNTMNKAELMHYVLQVLQFLEVTRSDLQVKVYGQVAVMTGKMHTRMKHADKPEPMSAESWVTQVWVKRASSWVQTNFHAVRAAAPVVA